MAFAEKISYLRRAKGVTQTDMAKALGITSRTLQNYEAGVYLPRKVSVAEKIAAYFDVPLGYLMCEEDRYVRFLGAENLGGNFAQRDLSIVLSELGALFSGGKLSETDKDLVMKTMNEIYWDSKEKSKKD